MKRYPDVTMERIRYGRLQLWLHVKPIYLRESSDLRAGVNIQLDKLLYRSDDGRTVDSGSQDPGESHVRHFGESVNGRPMPFAITLESDNDLARPFF